MRSVIACYVYNFYIICSFFLCVLCLLLCFFVFFVLFLCSKKACVCVHMNDVAVARLVISVRAILTDLIDKHFASLTHMLHTRAVTAPPF